MSQRDSLSRQDVQSCTVLLNVPRNPCVMILWVKLVWFHPDYLLNTSRPQRVSGVWWRLLQGKKKKKTQRMKMFIYLFLLLSEQISLKLSRTGRTWDVPQWGLFDPIWHVLCCGGHYCCTTVSKCWCTSRFADLIPRFANVNTLTLLPNKMKQVFAGFFLSDLQIILPPA